MKKILLVLAVALASVQFSQAQTGQGDISIGGGLAYGTGVAPSLFNTLNNSLGIQLGGYYTITESQLRAGLDFIYYFPDSQGGTDFKVWELNANAHYIFVEEADFFVYGIGGINITNVEISYQDDEFFGFGGSYSESEIGLNLGAGIEYNLGFANFYGEAKYGNLGGDASQLVITAGLRFLIN